MLRPETRDFVVVGAGLVGLSVAVELAGRGHDVVCLEAAAVGHEWSGSRGGSRLYRLGYDDPLYVDMARRALDGWRALEDSAGQPILLPSGLLSYGAGLDDLVSAMLGAGGSPELLAAAEVTERYPGLSLPGDAVLDPSAGVILADRALAALAGLLGDGLREGTTVRTVEDVGRAVRIRTTAGVIEAGAVVVCAGPASARLLGAAGIPCRLVPTLEQVAYFSVPPGPLPALTGREEGATDELEHIGIYGLPVPTLGWYKFGLHHAGPIADLGRAPLGTDPVLLERIATYAVALVKGLDAEPRLVERCVYDNTDDGDFVIDRVGGIVVGAGTSGHGFKFGPFLGSLLADLATGSTTAIDLSRFSVARAAVTGP